MGRLLKAITRAIRQKGTDKETPTDKSRLQRFTKVDEKGFRELNLIAISKATGLPPRIIEVRINPSAPPMSSGLGTALPPESADRISMPPRQRQYKNTGRNIGNVLSGKTG